jgi:hypothetical protein
MRRALLTVMNEGVALMGAGQLATPKRTSGARLAPAYVSP